MQKSKFEDTYFRRNNSIRVGDKLLDLSKPRVMGILNVTPDSFYAASRVDKNDDLLRQAEKMLNEGADILDLGGYSSRPGATDISKDEELKRIIPAVEGIKKAFPGCILSLDTFRENVAEAGIAAGADIINDISGFSIESGILDVISRYKVPYILMHIKGTPQTMHQFTDYDNLINDVIFYFSEKLHILRDKGIHDVIIDPGFGFSKTMEQNHALMASLEHFRILGAPVLVGISRKGMVYKKLGIRPEDALPGTIALNAIALSKGAKILRVHDVKEACDLIRLLY